MVNPNTAIRFYYTSLIQAAEWDLKLARQKKFDRRRQAPTGLIEASMFSEAREADAKIVTAERKLRRLKQEFAHFNKTIRLKKSLRKSRRIKARASS